MCGSGLPPMISLWPFMFISPPVSKGRRAFHSREERYQSHRGGDNHSNGAFSPGADLSLPNHAKDFDTVDPAGSYYVELQSPLPGEPTEFGDNLSERIDWPPPLKQEGGRRVTVSKPEETPFYRKSSFLIGLAVALVIGISLLFLLLYPVVGAIAQHVVNASRLNVDRVAIADPTNTSFSLHMDGWVSHAGIFSAQISFVQPLRVSWVNGIEEIPLGLFDLQPLSVKKKRIYINQTTDFAITDENAFGQFTQSLITSNNFTLRLRSNSLHVRALAFPVSKGVRFEKDLTLSGINNFEGNVVLKEFKLPSGSSEGGINFYAVITLMDSSPFQMNLGTVVFNLLYVNMFLGQGIGTNTTIAPGSNDIALSGQLVLPSGSGSELAALGHTLIQYSNSDTSRLVAQGVSTLQNDNTSISWLSSGVQALRLDVPIVASPIVQTLIDGASLAFTAVNITNISDAGFNLTLEGALANIGPLDAVIEFEEPVTITWQGQDIAAITLPPIHAAANVGVPDYYVNTYLTITDEEQFTAFATFLLHNSSFTWTIHTTNLRVTALSTIFDGVSLSKDVTFKAFNGLPGVTISNFQLPSDDPEGGIRIETDSLIPSPAQLGIELGTVGFQASFEGTPVGPLSTTSLTLAPLSATEAHLSGRITPKSTDELVGIGKLFSQFLAGQNQTLSIQDVSVQPSGTVAVGWLSSAFKTLTLQVILPGQIYQFIDSITITDLEVIMTEQSEAFEPLTSSQHSLATYKNPFGFSLQVVQATEDIILGAGGQGAAELTLPQSNVIGGVSTGNIADLEISFSNQPLHSLDNLAFATFLAAVTDIQSLEFELKGSADVVARTTIGDIPISNIPFNLTSTIEGMNSFENIADLGDVTITGSGGNAGNQYINADLTTTLQNPSNISLRTNNISLAIFYEDTNIGRAVIETLNLVPGENTISAEFHYEPDNANDTTAQSFLSQFIQTGDTLPLTIKGDSSSSPYASLVPALQGISLTSSLTGLNVPPIITHINVYIPLSAIFDNLVFVDFDIANPFDVDMHITFAQVDSGVGEEIYAHFDESFTGFTVPAKGTANSGKFGNVVLTKGALASLSIIPLGLLDVSAMTTVMIGDGGYTIPWLHLTQLNVPTKYDLSGLSLDDLHQALANSTARRH